MTYMQTMYASLAKSGINILQVEKAEHNGVSYLFEYSWQDPHNSDKLRWSKANIWEPFTTGIEQAYRDIIKVVAEARQELERGE